MSDIQSAGALSGASLVTDVATFQDFAASQQGEQQVSEVVNTSASSRLETQPHSIADLFFRPVKVAEVTLTGAEATGALLFTQRAPSGYFGANYLARLAASGYCFFRAKSIVFRILIAPPSGTSGLLYLAYRYQSRATTGNWTTDLAEFTGYPGAWINLASCQVIEIRIPWATYLDFSDVRALFTDGFDSDLVRRRFDVLEVGLFSVVPMENNTSLVVNVLTYFEGAELSVACAPTTPPTPPGPLGKEKKKQVKTLFRRQGPGGVVRKMTAVTSQALDTTASLARLAGCRVPLPDDARTTTITGCAAEFAHVRGPSTAVVMSDDQGSLMTDGESLRDTLDIMNVAGQPQYLEAVAFPRTASTGDIVWAAAADPGWLVGRSTPTPSTTATWSCTRLQALYLMHAFWRGGFRAHFKIVKSAWHRGKLAFVFRPEDRSIKTTAFTTDEIANSYAVIFDLEGQADYVVNVPFVSQFPWALCRPHDADGAGANPALMTNTDFPGFLYLVVYNPLTTTSAVCDSDAVILAGHSASPATEFAVVQMKLRPDIDETGMARVYNYNTWIPVAFPAAPGPNPPTSAAHEDPPSPRERKETFPLFHRQSGPDTEVGVRLQAGPDDTMETAGEPLEFRLLRNNAALTPIQGTMSMTQATHLHDLIQRPQLVGTGSAYAASTHRGQFPLGHPLAVLALMFTYYRGSLKGVLEVSATATGVAAVLPSTGPGTSAVTFTPYKGTISLRSPVGNHVAGLVPMVSPTMWRPLYSGEATDGETNDMALSAGSWSGGNLWVAAGPDFAFRTLVGFPRVAIVLPIYIERDPYKFPLAT